MRLTMFVTNAGSTAGKPGVTQNILRLALMPKGDKIDDENKDVFPQEATKGGGIEFQGLSDSAIGAFKGGQRVVVTIEPAP